MSDKDLFEQGVDVGRDVSRVANDVTDFYQKASDKMNLGEIYQESPLLVLGLAAGVGYALGGGLFTPFTMRLAKLGVRALLLPVAGKQLESLGTPKK